MRKIALVIVGVLALPAAAQEPGKPGPEHQLLKRLEGTWEITTKAGGMEARGTMTYQMELGGLWLVGSMKSAPGSPAFSGKSMNTYDPRKKKYINVWFDSLSTTPLTTEGTYDKDKKAFTMIGAATGGDGKPVKIRSVFTMVDRDTLHFLSYVGSAKEPTITMTFKRKK